ncbi:MAG TPA: copper chaperone PCu(A)C [Azospirillaceae bacterium]|nr:copper chaperone PCu(A)C [Azospirillaceae bacterium]
MPIGRPGGFLLGLALLGCAAQASSSAAHDFRSQDIRIGHPWAAPATAGTTEAYVALLNLGSSGDRLVAAGTPGARSARLMDRNGAEVSGGIELPPGRGVSLRPGGSHVRLEGLERPLRPGDRFPLTLRFARTPEVTVDVIVEDAPAH